MQMAQIVLCLFQPFSPAQPDADGSILCVFKAQPDAAGPDYACILCLFQPYSPAQPDADGPDCAGVGHLTVGGDWPQTTRPLRQVWEGRKGARPLRQVWEGRKGARPLRQVWEGRKGARSLRQVWEGRKGGNMVSSSLCINYFSTIALWAIQPDWNLKSPTFFVVVIIHNTIHVGNVLTCTYFNFGCAFLRTNNSTISIYVNLFLCLVFYSKISIDRASYYVYNSNRPTSRVLDLGFGLIN